MSSIYVIHENDVWVEPLRDAFNSQELPFEEWFIDGGKLDLDGKAPEGVFYNRMTRHRSRSHGRGNG